jgi:ankyrin repeat protein
MSKTRIIDAVRHLDLDTARTLLTATPALLTVTDRQGRNLLHLACSVCCPAVNLPESTAARLVTFLLDRGMEIEAPMGRDKCTPLFFAVARGRTTTLIKLLLKRGASPARAPGGGLYAAGWFDDAKHLDLLLQAGAKIDVVAGITPFLACWIWKKFDAAKFLARKGANVNFQDPKSGKTALHYGVEKEFEPALLAWLVAHGGSPDIADRDGVTARVKASRKRDKKWHAALS